MMIVLTSIVLVVIILNLVKYVEFKNEIANLKKELAEQDDLIRHSLSKQTEKDFELIKTMSEMAQENCKQFVKNRADIRQLQENLKRAEFLLKENTKI